MAKSKNKPPGVRETARLAHLAIVVKALKKNSMAKAILAEERELLLELRSQLEKTSTSESSGDSGDTSSEARPESRPRSVSGDGPRLATG